MLEPTEIATWYLYVGLVTTRASTSFSYISVDGKLNASSESHWWLSELADFDGLSITEPGLFLIEIKLTERIPVIRQDPSINIMCHKFFTKPLTSRRLLRYLRL